MRDSKDEFLARLQDRGIAPGASVTWPGIGQRRYGCVLEILGNGLAEVVASNGRHQIHTNRLEACPYIADPVTADVYETWPELRSRHNAE